MDIQSQKGYTYSQSDTNHHRRRRRRSCLFLFYTLLIVAAVLMLGLAGKIFWEGAREFIDLFSFSGDTPQIEILITAPAESDSPDHEPPALSGIRDLSVYAGDSVSYLTGVTAVDEYDPTPTITVDSRAVDLSTPGIYEVEYTATDAAGNSCCAAASVTVLEKQAGFTDLETINAAADQVLSTILWDNAPVQEQVYAIYSWARTSLSYGGHSDRTDWRQTAYTMLTDGTGDCFGYYAVTKLLFERLDIPNIDVQKVRNYENDSDHFWSLVSTDGGETWYHFDATPRYGGDDDFCLVTDSYLDAYSDSHKGSHNRDTSLYPATPEEAL